MTPDLETRRPALGRIPPLVRWLLWAQLGLAGIALAQALLPFCGRCGSGSWTHALVAGAGILGYAGLLLLERKAMTPLVAVGLLGAGGVHAALGGIMLATGSLCIVCTVVALVSLSNVVAVLVSVPGCVRWIPRALVPSFSFTWIVATLALSSAAADSRKVREAASRALEIPSQAAKETTSGRSVLSIFEMEGCAYCRFFRSSYAPRLAREFPDLEISYRRAEDALWVRRMPTIVLGDKVLFEGLPTDYAQLARAVALGGSDGKNQKR